MAKTGREWKNHKYIQKKTVNGKTRYYYENKRTTGDRINFRVKKAVQFVENFGSKTMDSVKDTVSKVAKRAKNFLKDKLGYMTIYTTIGNRTWVNRANWDPYHSIPDPKRTKHYSQYRKRKNVRERRWLR